MLHTHLISHLYKALGYSKVEICILPILDTNPLLYILATPCGSSAPEKLIPLLSPVTRDCCMLTDPQILASVPQPLWAEGIKKKHYTTVVE